MARTNKSTTPATLTFRVSPQTRKKLRKRAEEEFITEQALASRLFDGFLRKDGIAERLEKLEDRFEQLAHRVIGGEVRVLKREPNEEASESDDPPATGVDVPDADEPDDAEPE